MKGLSLEQLDYLYEKRTPTRMFRGYVFDDDVLATGHIVEGANADELNLEKRPDEVVQPDIDDKL